MFVEAIEEVAKFTRAIHTISRNYNDNIISPGAATLFFVNENGVAVTCRHVMELIGNRQAINDHYAKFKAGAPIGFVSPSLLGAFLLELSFLIGASSSSFTGFDSGPI